MRKWGVFISIILCCFFLFTLAGCKKSDSSSELADGYAEVTPTCSVTNIPATPSLTLPAVTDEAGEETLDDLSSFLPINDCDLDYAFQVVEVGSNENRTSYMVNGNYDLNGDGIEDSISILQKGRDDNLSYIEINEIKLSFNMDFPMDGEVHIIDLDKNDPYLEVANYDDGPSGDPEFRLFRYDGSSIIELGSIDAGASFDGRGRLISSFHRNNYFNPGFCSAWYEIINNTLVRKNNKIDQYLGKMYDFSGGDAYFIPYEELPDQPDIQWDEMKHFEACKVKLIDIWGLNKEDRGLNFSYIELPTGEKGLIYFWIGD
jgi:hypothetical protein